MARLWRRLATARHTRLAISAALFAGVAGVAGAAGAAASVAGHAAVRGRHPARSRPGGPDEVTGSQDNLRTGWDPSEPGLSPAAVHGGAFGRIFSRRVDGQVYAQPLVVGNIVVVATENDWVYGLKAATGAVIWSKSLGKPWPASSLGCTDLQPNVGVTGAPVYDPATGRLYLVAETVPAGHTARTPRFKFEALDAQTGAVAWRAWIQGRATDSGRAFNAFYQLQRPDLLMVGGSVYAAFGSHCDDKPYLGYVAGVNTSTHAVTLWADESGVVGDLAGIWQSGGGLMSDGPGRIFFTSGNGVSPPPRAGSSPPRQLAESVVRLAVRPNGSLAARDFFSPADAPALDAADGDFGSGSPVGLPFGTRSYPNLLVQAGKDGRVFLLDRNKLGGREQGAHRTDAAVSETGPFGGQWGHPAVFGDTTVLTPANSATAHDYVYYLGRTDFLRALRLKARRGRPPKLTDVANSSFTFAYTSGSPVVTSNGTDPASAIVWVVKSAGPGGGKGMLLAFDAKPVKVRHGQRLREIWGAPIGVASKFAIPATSNGRVYVGTRAGRVFGFGLTKASPLRGAPSATFPATAVGAAADSVVAVTAAGRVTVSGVRVASASTAFTVGRVTLTRRRRRPVAVRFPVRLRPGDTLRAAVAFRPQTPGGTTGVLSFATRSAAFPSVDVPLIGDGTKPGLYAQPTSVSFALSADQSVVDVPVGISVPATVDVTNGGANAETIATVSGPPAPFTATGLPTAGAVIGPGQTLVVQVSYAPTQAGPASGAFTITTADGRSLTVSLSGTGAPAVGGLTAPAVVRFGSVRVGHQAQATIPVANSGDMPTTITGVSLSGTAFRAPFRVLPGLPVNPSYDLAIPVLFRPKRPGAATGYFRITWTDRNGTHTEQIKLTGTGVA